METYTPVDPDFIEMVRQKANGGSCHVVYFVSGRELGEIEGPLAGLDLRNGVEYFLLFASGEEVRIDRIITFNRMPGPAFGEYDAYALACLDCQSGMDM